MTTKEVLERLYDQVMGKVHDTSEDYRFTIPKKGHERKWAEHKETAEVLAELIEDCAE